MPVPLSKIQSPTGHEFHHGHGPCRGTVFPHPTPVGMGFSLEEGCGVVPHTGSWHVPIGGRFPCLDISFLGTACSKPDWNNRYPLCAVRQVSFCWGPASILPVPPLNRPAALTSIANASFSRQNYAQFFCRASVVRSFKIELPPNQNPGPRSP